MNHHVRRFILTTTAILLIVAWFAKPAATYRNELLTTADTASQHRNLASGATASAKFSSLTLNTLSFQDVVGLPPPPATPAFDQWLDDLVAYRDAEVTPVGNTTVTYHFAARGNDNNNGSQLAPKRSLAEAQRLIDEAPAEAGLRLRFRKGDTWYTETGLFVDKKFVFIDSYGHGSSKPVFNRFTKAYNFSWTAVPEFPGVFRRSEETPIGWVYRQDHGWQSPFFRASSVANLLLLPEECAGSFFYDANNLELYVYLAGDLPSRANLRGLPANDDIGVRLNKHGNRVDGIIFLGFGLNPASTSNQAAGIKVTAHANQACVVADCESYYCSSHAVHFNAGNSTLKSGVATFIRCSAGFCQNNGTPGETIFNSYVYQGDQETIFSDCEARFGTLPDDTWFVPGVRELRGTSCFAHTAVGKTRLLVNHRMQVTGGPFGCARNTRFADTPNAATLADVRSFVVGEQFDQVRPGAQIDIGGLNLVRQNCLYRAVLGNHSFRAWSNNLYNQSWVLNCHFDIDATMLGAGYVGFYNSPGQHSMDVEHSDFVFRVLPSQRLRFPDYRATNSLATNWHNCVFGIIGEPRSYDVGYGVPVFDNNGFYGTAGNFGGDPLPIEIVNGLELQSDFIPESGDASYASGSTSWYQVLQDRQGFLRNDPPSLGDQEHEPPID